MAANTAKSAMGERSSVTAAWEGNGSRDPTIAPIAEHLDCCRVVLCRAATAWAASTESTRSLKSGAVNCEEHNSDGGGCFGGVSEPSHLEHASESEVLAIAAG
jgi:hypothetical protein